MDYSFLQEKDVQKKSMARHPIGLKFSVIVILLCMVSALFGANKEIFVSSDGTGDGTTAASPTTFQLALDQAHNIGDTVFINLLEGNYDASVQTFSYALGTGETEILVIRGGFNSEGNINNDPEITVLDGGGTSQILNLRAQAENGVLEVFISNISFLNGFAHDDGNSETVDHGGAISAYEGNADLHGSCNLEVNNCIFMNNKTASGYNGGAIYSNVLFKINRSSFKTNEGGSGGAIIAYAGPLGDVTRICTIEKSDFHENKNTGNQGSSIWHNLVMEITDCEFLGMSDESLVGNGSCVWGSSGSTHKISRCLFKDIKVKYWGSAIQSFGGNAYIDNCIFVNNKAGEEAGSGDGYGTIAFYHNSLPATTKRITNCTFTGNRSRFPATSMGGAIYNRGINGDDFMVANCVCSDNGLYPLFSYANIATVKNSLTSHPFTGFTDGGGNIGGDPLFSDMYKHLSENSPCINTGTNAAEPVMETDFDGNRRILSGTIDMGAHEYNHKPDSISISNTLLSENSGVDFTLGTLSAKDPDPEDMVDLLFSLIPGDGVNDVDNDKFRIQENSLIAKENADFEEDTVWYIHIEVSDFGGLKEEASFGIEIKDENDPVIANGTISDQSVLAGDLYSFIFEEDLFTDQDPGDELGFSAILDDDSALPAWLGFDGLTRSFSGTPMNTDAGNLLIKIVASDGKGSSASVTYALEVEFNTYLEKFTEEDFRIFPNPAKDKIRIIVPDELSEKILRIYNCNGILVKEINDLNEGANELLIDELPSGIYFVLLGEEERLKGKFVVQ